MSNLTPAQLEQFESTFRYFDRNETNTLELAEMTAALASLGIVYSVMHILRTLGTMTEQVSGGRLDHHTRATRGRLRRSYV